MAESIELVTAERDAAIRESDHYQRKVLELQSKLSERECHIERMRESARLVTDERDRLIEKGIELSSKLHTFMEAKGALHAERDALERRLNDVLTAGWRSCIDHLIKPSDPCPVCRLSAVSKLLDDWEKAIERGVGVQPRAGIYNLRCALAPAVETHGQISKVE